MSEPITTRSDQRQGSVLRHFVFAPGPDTRNRPFFYLISLVLFLLVAFTLQAAIGLGLAAAGERSQAVKEILTKLAVEGQAALPWYWMLLLVGFSFAAFWVALAIVVPLVHDRAFRTIFTDRARFDGSRAFAGFLLYVMLLAGPFLFYIATTGQELEANVDLPTLVPLLLLSVTVLLIQTATEEAIFRGYLTQFVASIMESRFFIAGIPAALFAAAHLDNPELAANPGYLLFYFGFGVFMSLIAMRERGLELVIGAHFANNLVNAVLVRNADSVLQTPAIFILPSDVAEQPTVVALTGLLTPVIFFVVTALWRRKA